MDCSALIRTLRSTIVAAFLTPGLTGCGNAQAGAGQAVAADTAAQDWETQPPLWAPRPIVIARARLSVAPSDSTRDTTGSDSSRADSMPADSLRGDTTRVDSVRADSGKPVARVKVKKSRFNISSADSAL